MKGMFSRIIFLSSVLSWCGDVLIFVGVFLLIGTAYASDLATNKEVIQGSWYCQSPGDPMTQRFDFNLNGTVMWFSYLASKHNKHFWSASFTDPWHYIFRSPTKIELRENNTFLIESLTPDVFSFRWIAYGTATSYACIRTRPPDDTDDRRMESAALIDDQKKAFLGKWKAAGGREYVEFLPGDVCLWGILKNGRWQTTKYRFSVYHEGKNAMCGDTGMFSIEVSDKIVLDYGMGGDPIIYRRTSSNKK